MRFVLLVCFISVAMATVSLKRENMTCAFEAGDRVVTTGTIETIDKNNGQRANAMALVIGLTPLSFLLRVEVFGGIRVIRVHTKTNEQSRPRNVYDGTYIPQNKLKIEVKITPLREFEVLVDDIRLVTVPNVGGLAPTFVETIMGFDTEELQVFSACATNPAGLTIALSMIAAAQTVAAELTTRARKIRTDVAPLEGQSMNLRNAAGVVFVPGNPLVPQAAAAENVAVQCDALAGVALTAAQQAAQLAQEVFNNVTTLVTTYPSSFLVIGA